MGRCPSGLAGLYIYFMLLAHEWMENGAVGAWLIPSEWADVKYGHTLRTYLTTQVTLLRVHQFAAADTQFDDALVTSSVVYFRKEKPRANTTCELTSGTLNTPSTTIVSLENLQRETKWSRLFKTDNGEAKLPEDHLPLGAIFDVKRGIATGANKFFIQPFETFRKLGIDRKFLRPILPSAKYLSSNVIERRADGYPDIDSPLALLDCRLSEHELRKNYPEVLRYLTSEDASEVKARYLTSRRTPWYLQETRPVAPILATYMGRGRAGETPFRFFTNQSDAIAPNVYLLLIPKPALARVFAKTPSAVKKVVDFLSAVDATELVGHGRIYGGGLYKLEPKELAMLNVNALAKALKLSTLPPKPETGLLFSEAALQG